VSAGEVDRRYANVRAALERDGLDAALVCGSEYTGFEGAVTYVSGFLIVHRYAYVLLPVEGEPTIVFPSEARYVGEHGDSEIADQQFVDRPGEWLAGRLRGKRVGVYGMDYVMTVRDFAALGTWTVGAFRRTVVWRGNAFSIGAGSTLLPHAEAPGTELGRADREDVAPLEV